MDTWLEIEMGNILKEEKALCQREWAGELGKRIHSKLLYRSFRGTASAMLA